MKLKKGNLLEDLQRWQKAYVVWMNTRDYSDNTISLYNRVINTFKEYAEPYSDEDSLTDIRSSFFDGFINYLEQQAQKKGKSLNRDGKYLSKSTKDTYMKALKGFFSYISDNNDELYTFDRFLKWNKKRDNSKLEEKLVYLSEDEVQKLIKTIEEEKNRYESYNSYRNALAIKLMLFAGLRISEVLSLRLIDLTEDSDETLYTINIHGKGGKEQLGYISKAIIEDEMEYFHSREDLKKDEYIMQTSSKRRWDRQSAFDIVNRIYKKAGIQKRGLHLLRHTLAMRLTQRGENLVVIKKILRHSSISTTTIYSKAVNKSVANALGGLSLTDI